MTCSICGFDYRYSQMRKIKWPSLTGTDTSSISRGSGSNLITNGSFELGSTAPSSWTAASGATLHRHADPNTGTYCLEINEGGTVNPYAYQDVIVAVGESFKFSGYVKAGTGTSYKISIVDGSNGGNIVWEIGTATASYVKKTYYFTIPAGCVLIAAVVTHQVAASVGTTILFDDVELYESTGYLTTGRDAPEGAYVCPKCYDGKHIRNTEVKLRKKQPMRYPE